ncbi:hypothetical protein ACOSQ3_014621 [Xanthoceras sorbifolium]
MFGMFLLIVGQNSRYCQTSDTFSRSHFTASKNFNKILKALNTIALELIAQPSPTVSAKIKESTRFYPYFKRYLNKFFKHKSNNKRMLTNGELV